MSCFKGIKSSGFLSPPQIPKPVPEKRLSRSQQESERLSPSAEEDKDNQLVCELYGLTGEEIAMVKSEPNP